MCVYDMNVTSYVDNGLILFQIIIIIHIWMAVVTCGKVFGSGLCPFTPCNHSAAKAAREQPRRPLLRRKRRGIGTPGPHVRRRAHICKVSQAHQPAPPGPPSAWPPITPPPCPQPPWRPLRTPSGSATRVPRGRQKENPCFPTRHASDPGSLPSPKAMPRAG